MSVPAAEYTNEEIAKHNHDKSCWIVIDGFVYDVTKFINLHPGGPKWLRENGGADVSEQFKMYHGAEVMRKYKSQFCIGTVQGYSDRLGSKFRLPGSFGDLVPYGDPLWYQRFNSPYYSDSHRAWRKYVRHFVQQEVIATMDEWKKDYKPPEWLLRKMGDAGLLAAMMGPPCPQEYITKEAAANIPDDFDYFHELILFDEFSRCGDAAVISSITNGPAIGLSAIFRFGSDELKNRVMPDVLMGRKFIALAISEPNAGSDVAGLVTEAVRSGDHFVINGNKKWITNGTYADYYVTACVTTPGGGQNALSLLVVESSSPGFDRRKVSVPGSFVSGTAYLTFDNCRVPTANLIGKENKGFKLIMYNFNHERFYVSVCCARLARVCLEESFKYALRRKAFGKPLAKLQSIRLKIASMARQVEQLQAWLDIVAYQMCTMTHEEANMKIGDVVCLLKAQASKVYEHCARETTMIFGGSALMETGVGGKIVNAVAQVKGYQIPAGAEDVMDDFAARFAFKNAVAMANL